ERRIATARTDGIGQLDDAEAEGDRRGVERCESEEVNARLEVEVAGNRLAAHDRSGEHDVFRLIVYEPLEPRGRRAADCQLEMQQLALRDFQAEILCWVGGVEHCSVDDALKRLNRDVEIYRKEVTACL